MERRQDETPGSSPAEAVGEDAQATATPGDAPPSFLARHFKALLIALIVLAAAAGAGVAYMQYGRVAQVATALPFVGGGGETGEKAEPEGPGSFTEMKGLVVNPAESGGARYLAVSLAFETNSPAVLEELKAKEIVLRDAVLDLLSQHTAAELSATDRRDELKERLRGATNDLLNSGTVDRLYFTQFVLQ